VQAAVCGWRTRRILDFEVAVKQAARLISIWEQTSPGPLARPNKGKTPHAEHNSSVWDREQEALKSLSSSSWRIITRDSGHKIFQNRPEVVTAEMSRLIGFPRDGSTPTFGSTHHNASRGHLMGVQCGAIGEDYADLHRNVQMDFAGASKC
jgi:hypothetical protein